MSWVPAPSSYLRRDPTMAPRNLDPARFSATQSRSILPRSGRHDLRSTCGGEDALAPRNWGSAGNLHVRNACSLQAHPNGPPPTRRNRHLIHPNEEGGFSPLGAMPLVMVLLLVDAIAAIAGTGPLVEWSPGIAGLPLAGALGVAEYRRLSAWPRRHDTSPR